MAKLVDAIDSKSFSSNRVLVRVRSPAKIKKPQIFMGRDGDEVAALSIKICGFFIFAGEEA